MKYKLSTVKELFLLVLVKILLEISYVFYVGKLYGYYGFVYSLNYYKLFESYLVFTVIFLLLPKNEKSASRIILRFLFLTMIIPTLSFYALADESRVYFYLFSCSFMLTVVICTIFPHISLRRIKLSNKFLLSLIFMFSFVTYILFIRANGIPSLTALNLSRVYEIRSNIVYNSRLLMYFVFWQIKVINPFLIGFCYYQKKYRGLFIVLIMQLILYLITGHKSILFSPVLVLAVAYILKHNKSIMGLVSKLLVCGISSSLLIFLANISEWPANLLIRRVLFVPALNYFHYYDFFSSHRQFLYLAEGQIGRLLSIKSPYDMPIVNLIGETYYNNPATSANTGYLGDAYANFGWYGMILFSLILGILLLLIDSFSSKSELSITMAAMIVPAFSLIESALLTTLLSNGLIISMIIIYLYKPNTSQNGAIFYKNRSVKKHKEGYRIEL